MTAAPEYDEEFERLVRIYYEKHPERRPALPEAWRDYSTWVDGPDTP